MPNKTFNEGFSFIELLVVVLVSSILLTVAVPSLKAYYTNYKYNDYAYSMEYLIRGSKITAIERSVNIGVCVNSGTLQIINMGTSRADTCTGTALNTLQLEDNLFSLSGSGLAFDPRGFAIFPGDVCISNNAHYHKVVVSKFGGIGIEKGTGGCPQ
jgi:prepilin-type N-terminal cleavage/methylation domain-containing protein